MNQEHSVEILTNGGVVSPRGFLAGASRGEIKTEGDDVILIVAEKPATCATVFTRNLVKAAPVEVCASHAQSAHVRAIIANAGNANCCTGAQGVLDAERMCELAAKKIGCALEEVLVCSTGIIGHPLPIEKIEAALSDLELEPDPDMDYLSIEVTLNAVSEKIARAIMTTDTRPKTCAASTRINGQLVTVGGCVKGAGMIGPDMGAYQPSAPHATLLAFLTTDAQIEKELLQAELERAVEYSFNSVTIDGDTSTNDTAILLASGASGVRITQDNITAFRALLEAVSTQLARAVARDGEGATRLVTIRVLGAHSGDDAKRAAMTIANSPLVSTAVFGGDPNWGRIAAAAGRSGANFQSKNLKIKIGDIEVFHNGEPTEYSLPDAEDGLKQDEVIIEVDLGAGENSWTAWTCDFSYDYVKINAEYHT